MRDELFALLAVGFRISLAGMERLFFRRRPSFRNKCQICGKLNFTPASALNFI